jgi:hypothetical protein
MIAHTLRLFLHRPWILYWAAMLCFVLTILALIYVVSLVNRKLPVDKRIRLLHSFAGAQRRYRELYPGRVLYLLPWMPAALMVVFLIAFAIDLGALRMPWAWMLGAFGFSAMANACTFIMIARINRRRSPDDSFSFMRYTVYEVYAEYERLYGSSVLFRSYWVFCALMFLCGIVFFIDMIAFQR